MYRVHLADFEGPLDLLLFFIRRDELDIYDIPIARIADEYLAYVRVLESVDLDNVGEFLYLAALLVSIKAKMLLPKPELDEEGEPIDPRRELMERLLEYVRYKEAAEQLGAREEERLRHFGRLATPEREAFGAQREQIASSTLFDLVGALRRILTEVPDAEPTHDVEVEAYSVEAQRAFLARALGEPGSAARGFGELVSGRTKPFVIATFLAALELARLGRVTLAIAASGLDFFLAARVPPGDAPALPQDDFAGAA